MSDPTANLGEPAPWRPGGRRAGAPPAVQRACSLGVRPETIASVPEAELELLRERIRDSRWARRERQLRWALTVAAPMLAAAGAHVAGLVR